MSKNFKHLAPLALLVFAICQLSESASLPKEDDKTSTNDQIPIDGILLNNGDLDQSKEHSRTKRSGSYSIPIPPKFSHLYTPSQFVVLGVFPSVFEYSFTYKESEITNHIGTNNQAPGKYPGGAQQPQYPGGTQQPQYPGGAQQPQYPGGTQQPQYPGGNQQPQYPGGTQQPQYPGGNQQPQYPGAQQPQYPGGNQRPQYPEGAQQPQTPPGVQFNASRFDGTDDDDSITFMENDNNNNGFTTRAPPNYPYPGQGPSRPSANFPSQKLPADDYETKYFNTLTGISLEKIPPSRPDSRPPPPIAHGPDQSSFRGKREVTKKPVLARGPTGGGCSDCKPI